MTSVVRVWCGFALLLLAGPAWADARLRGRVVRNHVHGEPMEGVAVGATGANPTWSLSDGTFELGFPSQNPDVYRPDLAKTPWCSTSAASPPVRPH